MTRETSSRPKIIADDATFPHMSAYDCPWINTAAFDRVVKEGFLFMCAYTPNALLRAPVSSREQAHGNWTKPLTIHPISLLSSHPFGGTHGPRLRTLLRAEKKFQSGMGK